MSEKLPVCVPQESWPNARLSSAIHKPLLSVGQFEDPQQFLMCTYVAPKLTGQRVSGTWLFVSALNVGVTRTRVRRIHLSSASLPIV